MVSRQAACDNRQTASRPEVAVSFAATGRISLRVSSRMRRDAENMQSRIEQVLIVGGGPVGLALAGDLGWRGIPCLLIEQSDGSIYQPRMDLVGIRTMEFCRRWGLVPAVEGSLYPRDYAQDNIYLTSLIGYELGRERFPGIGQAPAPKESPQRRERCPQNIFDPILRAFASSQKAARCAIARG
jgi:hypothetical protein